MTFAEQLNKKVLENPDAKIIFSVSEDTCFHEYSSLYIHDCDTYMYVEDMAEYNGKLLCEEDLIDEISCDLDFLGDYPDFTCEEIDKIVDDKIKNEFEFTKYIVIRVGN